MQRIADSIHPLARATRVLIGCTLLIASSAAQVPIRVINGFSAGAQFGRAMLAVADQNGDGFRDLLVGAPGVNSGRGAMYCISGRYLANSAGALVLWSVVPSINPDDRFGTALADVGDVTGDGVADFVVGEPGYDAPFGNVDAGAIRLIDGSTHALLSLIYDHDIAAGFGSTLAVAGDLDGDGKKELVVGAPSAAGVHTGVYALRGAQLATGGDVATHTFFSVTDFGGAQTGAALASGIDINHDSFVDLVIGEPGYGGVNASGRIQIYSFVGTSNYFHWNDISFGVSGERFGSALAFGGDFDGDGVAEILVGAPNALGAGNVQSGRVVVLSGHRAIAGFIPYDIATLRLGVDNAIAHHFGAALHSGSDLNGDGAPEILIGAPDFGTTSPPALGKGSVAIFSGATLTRWTRVDGNVAERLGDSIAGALDDLDGDGFPEFVVAGALADSFGTDSGVMKCFRLFPIAPSTYCTGKTNSLGCTPTISFNGAPSSSSSAPFLITASQLINQKNGLLFYSHAPLNSAFQGGTKCVASPIVRAPTMNSGGSTSGADCSGTFSFDFNARIQSGVDAALVAGTELYAQFWSRDPASASQTSLTDAVLFVVSP